MIEALLFRRSTGDQGTFGELNILGCTFYSLELPWRFNRANLSRIPQGEYIAKPFKSQRFGSTYRLLNVPDRSDILIHSGNFAGDVEKGWLSNSHGCILIGKNAGTIRSQLAVLLSKLAVYEFNRLLSGRDIKLIIKGV